MAWIVLRDQPQPGALLARLVTETPTLYLLVGDTLAEVQALLPAHLERSDEVSFGPPDLVEIWFAKQGHRRHGLVVASYPDAQP